MDRERAHWDRIVRQYRHGFLSHGELVEAFVARADLVRLSEQLAALPEAYLEELERYIHESPGAAPHGIYYFAGVSDDESRRLHAENLERNRRVIEAIRTHLDAGH